MTKGDLDGVLWYDRPVKPLAGFLVLLMLNFTIFNVSNEGIFKDFWLNDVIAILASLSCFSLFYAWIARNQTMVEIGLVLASTVYFIRAFFILFLSGAITEPFVTSFLTGGLVAAAFYMEARDSVRARREKKAT